MVVETINIGIGQGEWVGMILTVLIFYGLFIILRLLVWRKNYREPIKHPVTVGCIGLLAESFIFGMSPWPGGNLPVVLFLQTGMSPH